MGNLSKIKCAFLTTDARVQLGSQNSPEPDIGPAPAALLKAFSDNPELEVHVISCTQQAVSAPAKLADNIWFHSLVVPKIGWARTFYQGCVRAVRKKLGEIQPDIVHGQGTERDCALASVLSGYPNVLTIHGNMRAIAKFHRARPGSFHWLAARLEAFALRRTNGVFCNSAYTESEVAPLARKIWRVPNALRLEFFETGSENSPSQVPVLLNVGVLSPYKRQREILAMAGRLWNRGLKFEMRFIGSRPDHGEYDLAFARELAAAQTAGFARHLGTLNSAELISAMDKAVALIHSPTEEAFGLVVAEGLARGLKFFGSTTGGVPDIANEVEGAELFPAQDWDGLENAIARWIAAGCPRPTTAAVTMRERYHPLVIARRHVEIYREVLAGK